VIFVEEYWRLSRFVLETPILLSVTRTCDLKKKNLNRLYSVWKDIQTKISSLIEGKIL